MKLPAYILYTIFNNGLDIWELEDVRNFLLASASMRLSNLLSKRIMPISCPYYLINSKYYMATYLSNDYIKYRHKLEKRELKALKKTQLICPKCKENQIIDISFKICFDCFIHLK